MDEEENQDNLAEDNKYLILKGRFKSNSLNFYGLFLLIFNKRQELDICHSIVSSFSTVYDIEPHFGWEMYEEFIVNSKWKDDYNPNMTASIQELLDRIGLEESQKILIYEYLKSYDYDNIDIFIFDILNRVIHDRNLILETGIQEVTAKEFSETRDKEFQSQTATDATEKRDPTEEGSVTLPVQLILAPVSGKPIYELKVGDKIMTKIIPNTDRANYFIDLLDLRVENHVKPVPCEVIDIKSEGAGSPLELLMQIGPGIYGKCLEDERQVKLRMYDPGVDGSFSKNKDVKKELVQKIIKFPVDKSSSIQKIIYLISGLVTVMIILFILFYLYL